MSFPLLGTSGSPLSWIWHAVKDERVIRPSTSVIPTDGINLEIFKLTTIINVVDTVLSAKLARSQDLTEVQ